MALGRLLWRSWYYFRTGYGVYLSLAIGIFSNIIVIYKLALASDPFLLGIFPHLLTFVAVSLPLGAMLGAVLGYLHLKRSGAFRADMTVSVEANQYNWMAMPGKERELIFPILIMNLESQMGIMEKLSILTPQLRERMNKAITSLERLGRGERL